MNKKTRRIISNIENHEHSFSLHVDSRRVDLENKYVLCVCELNIYIYASARARLSENGKKLQS